MYRYPVMSPGNSTHIKRNYNFKNRYNMPRTGSGTLNNNAKLEKSRKIRVGKTQGHTTLRLQTDIPVSYFVPIPAWTTAIQNASFRQEQWRRNVSR
jgi:hypothetical protein